MPTGTVRRCSPVSGWVGAGGTNLILTPPSSVTADGQPMTEQNGAVLSDTLPGRSYAHTTAGFQQQTEVKFITRTGKIHTNTLRLEKADFAADQPAQWNRARGVTVTFVGPPLTAGETVLLSLTSDATPTDRQQVNATAHSTKVGATSVTLTTSDLAPLPNGSGTATLTRTRTAALQQGTPTGGELVSNYFSKTIAVKLVN